MNENDTERIIAIKERAERRLLELPGVHAVGLGAKIVGGTPSGELAITVLVMRKKPLAQLGPKEIVPREIEGIKTDVSESPPPINFADTEEYRPLRGGTQIQIETSVLSGPPGTMGCIAQTNRAGETPRIVVLSCAHVIYEDLTSKKDVPLGPITQRGSRACQPTACSICSRCCSDVIGRALRGEFTEEVDAAIATVNSGISYRREIEDSVRRIAGTHSITVEEAASGTYTVRKRGRATEETEGLVLAIQHTGRMTKGRFKRPFRNQIRIQPEVRVAISLVNAANATTGVIESAGAQFRTNNVQENDFADIVNDPAGNGSYPVVSVDSETQITVDASFGPGPSGGILSVRAKEFAAPGDSGAVVLNEDREIVGLLFGGIPHGKHLFLAGYGWACPIGGADRLPGTNGVVDRLGIIILETRNIGEELVVAAASSEEGEDPDAGEGVSVGLATAAVTNDQRDDLVRAQDQVLETARGRRYADLVQRHQQEVQTLINTNKRVATVWHRSGGPAIVQAVADAVQTPDEPLREEINGAHVSDDLCRIFNILAKYGSAGLCADIACHRRDILRLVGLSYNEVLQRLQVDDSTAAAVGIDSHA